MSKWEHRRLIGFGNFTATKIENREKVQGLQNRKIVTNSRHARAAESKAVRTAKRQRVQSIALPR